MRKYKKRALRPIEERLWDGIMPIPHCGCWIWMGPINTGGYGQIKKGRRNEGKILTHRLSYELFKGRIPDHLQIDHLCRIRSCCNPDHLELVTGSENVKRGICGQKKKYCKRGHEFTKENTVLTKRGVQMCKKCKNWHGRKFYHKNKKVKREYSCRGDKEI